MGQRFVPITITVEDRQAEAKVKGLSNAFDELDQSANKASSGGGFKNVFDQTTKLSSAQKDLGQHSDFAKQQLASLYDGIAKRRPELASTIKEVSNLSGSFEQASSTSTVLTGDVAALGSGVVAAASLVVALVLAVAGLAAGMVKGGQILFEWSRSVANATIEIDNFAKKTDLSLRTIEGLSGLAAAADVPLNSLASSLGTFEKNSESVREGNKGLSTAFRSLHIDIKDNETALRSAFEALGHLPPGYQRVAAAQRLFGEGGKDILLLLDRSNGSLDEAIQRYDELGT